MVRQGWPARSSRRRRPAARRLGAALLAVIALAASCRGTDAASVPPPAPGTTEGHVPERLAIDDRTPPPAITIGAPVEPVSPIALPATSPNRRLRRNCPLSLRMSDGRVLWLFCNSGMHDERTGDLIAFQNTTALWADPTDPTDPTILVEPVTEPVTDTNTATNTNTETADQPGFLTLTTAYQPCTDTPGSRRLVWLRSALVLPRPDGTDQVLVYYQSMCARSEDTFRPQLLRDVGLATFVYDPAHPPAPTDPLHGDIVDEQLFAKPTDVDSPFGTAAVLVDDTIYVYRCAGPDCFVGRVAAADAAEPPRYEFWNGSAWVAGEGNAVKMDMPGHVRSDKPSIRYIESSRLFVMLDRGDPDKGEVQLLVSRSPMGPWSTPVDFALPDCVFPFPQSCLALELHPDLSDARGLFVTWADPNIPNSETSLRGAHLPVALIPPTGPDGRQYADPPTLTG